MKVVIAIDSLKGSLSSMDAGHAIKEGILKATDADVIIKPLADGGEGTTDALIEGMGGEKISLTVKGPLQTPVEAYYGYLQESNTAIMEMAMASGITLIPREALDPLNTTTYGVGEMIKDAVHRGIRNFIIGIGGSATNDGGTGMLSALGYEFLDTNGQPVGFGGQCLEKIAAISDKNKLADLEECHFQIACDVENPLCGPKGATYIYGPQKGAANTLLPLLDAGMKNYGQIAEAFTGKQTMETAGAGAAGGLGFAFVTFLNGELKSGIDLILDAVGLEESLENADFVITGEGRLDQQTAMGKGPAGVAKLGKKYGAKTIALAGSVTEDASACNAAGIDGYFCILSSISTLEEAMNPDTARKNLTLTAEQLFRLL
ncbi:glycerate kinase [Frisingicoccus caecimuris]|uniref:Glycerate kinase n=1 Tax=Frisingicoccus caecimuris TaxID=1796636 RepID=A0A4R2LLS0_9FIRM|nr:glycerate kinase [Frisingicoccus caecimuris]MCR1917845.1 glycerate kinase [Frisingicoccus caecimuris]TCO86604.1 glycerate kinase [Frisingicoccus caecimuris]